MPWDTDADGGQALAEFAGRACYQSWKKPNPATATNAGYLRHILEVGHLSVLEHGSVTFYLSGISRSLTHELIRHRHFSYSQLSQRYVPERDAAMVEPDVIADDPELHAKFVAASEARRGRLHRTARRAGEEVRRRRARDAAPQAGPPGRARGAAERHRDPHRRHRQLPRLAALRRHARPEHADVEIRALAIACLRELAGIAPRVFADFEITTLPDGTEVASSPMVTEG